MDKIFVGDFPENSTWSLTPMSCILEAHYQVTAGAHSPLVFCDDLTELDIYAIWHSYVVYPEKEKPP